MSRRKPAAKDQSVETIKGFDDYDVRLGDLMRGERATMGKSLLDVQRDLKIKATYIAAIENADPSAFESPGFVAGYVRSYARYLKMDPEWAYKTFCDEGNFETINASLQPSPKPGKKSKNSVSASSALRDPLAEPKVSFVPAGDAAMSRIEPGAIGSVAVLMCLVGALGYGGWSVLQEVQKVRFTPVEQAPGVVSELQERVQDISTDLASAEPRSMVPSAEALDRLYRPQALDVPVLIARDGPIAAIDPSLTGTLAAPSQQPQPADLALARPAFQLPQIGEPVAPVDPVVQVVSDEPQQVMLFAVRPSWVRVQAAGGTVIFEKILDAGEEFVIPPTEEASVLRAGNSGSLYFRIGNETYGPAGDGTSVIRDVALDLDSVVAAYAVADLDTDADLARFVAVAEAQAD